jgi:hypothetical protein
MLKSLAKASGAKVLGGPESFDRSRNACALPDKSRKKA